MGEMDLNEILSESWNFMMKLTEDVGNMIILFVLNLIPIVNLIVWGYGARIVRRGDSLSKPPKIENYVAAFIDGLKIVIVGLLYLLIPLIIFMGSFALVSGGWRALFSPMAFINLMLSGIGIVGVAFSVILGFLFLIIGAMGIIYMVKSNDLSRAFAVSEILDLIEETGWSKYLGWLIIMFILGVVIVIIGNVIPVSGARWIILSLFGVFYITLLARSAHHIYPRKKHVEEAEK